jgi:hypothetical protein
MIARLSGFVAVILLGPFVVSFTYEAALVAASIVTFDSVKWFLLGLGLFLLLYVAFLNDKIKFLEHLEHEIEHAFMSFIFSGQLPKRLEVDPEKGSKVDVTKSLGCAVSLAPYFFPLLTMPFLLLKALVTLVFSLIDKPFPSMAAASLDILIGFTFAFHLVGLLKEFSPRQTDLKKLGLVFSTVFVFFLNVLFLLVILVVVTGSYGALLPYFRSGLVRTVAAYRTTLEFLQAQVWPRVRDLLVGLLN